jgi:F-type H+-transporting ATPase subunit b
VLIDWFTVSAQIINFLILVALLKRFLYGPVIKAMDGRQARIAARLSEAEEHIAAADEEAQAWREKNRDFEANLAAMMEKAEKEVEARKGELLQEAREEVKARLTAWLEALKGEKSAFLNDLFRHTSAAFVQVSRSALRSLAGVELERQILQVFVMRLSELPANPSETDAALLLSPGSRVVVTSSFEIPPDLRSVIERTCRESMRCECRFHYEISPALLCGVELRTGSLRVSWNLEEYLRDLEKNLDIEFDGRFSLLAEDTVSIKPDHSPGGLSRTDGEIPAQKHTATS